MDTTYVEPQKTPAALSGMEVRYMGTVGAVLDGVADGEAGPREGGLEALAAAEQEGDVVVGPAVAHVGHVGPHQPRGRRRDVEARTVGAQVKRPVSAASWPADTPGRCEISRP